MSPARTVWRRPDRLAALRATGQSLRIHTQQSRPFAGGSRHQHVREAQVVDIGRPQQGHQRSHVVGPRVQLVPEPIGAPYGQGVQEMPRDADRASPQGERAHDVERIAHASGGEHREPDGVPAAERIQEAQGRRLPPAGQVRVLPAAALVLDGDEVRAAGARVTPGLELMSNGTLQVAPPTGVLV